MQFIYGLMMFPSFSELLSTMIFILYQLNFLVFPYLFPRDNFCWKYVSCVLLPYFLFSRYISLLKRNLFCFYKGAPFLCALARM
jgi:hypothetical protein